jgi:ATP-binding cassette subfamily F protein uup
VGDLSGGERRRLQLTRLLMSGPNVLVLDEPTNDFDVETLSALEDLLDGFAGTLLVISHDRYFLERVCDDFIALVGDQKLRSLTGGVDQYLTVLGEYRASPQSAQRPGDNSPDQPVTSAAVDRENRKEMAKLEKQIAKWDQQQLSLHNQLAEHAMDFEKVNELNGELRRIQAEKEAAEERWLELAQ